HCAGRLRHRDRDGTAGCSAAPAGRRDAPRTDAPDGRRRREGLAGGGRRCRRRAGPRRRRPPPPRRTEEPPRDLHPGRARDGHAPPPAAARHRAARKNRHVTFTPGEHGMATVSAHLPALDAKLAHKRLSLEAERRRAEGARDGHGALMADAFTDTVLGREGGMEPVTLDLGVMITDRALLDPGCGDLARIEGYG